MAEYDLDLGDTFISITDEDGNEFELDVLDQMEYRDIQYLIAVEVTEEEREEEAVILKQVTDEATGEEMLSTPDTEEEYDLIYNLFMERLFDDEAGDDEEAEET